MRKISIAVLLAFVFQTSIAQKLTSVLKVDSSGKYGFTETANDPLKAKVYTLKNGLKVYMTVYKDAPRIQTYIAVKAGSKNDPADATGLAHYLEHMLFKGTDKFGTKDFLKEKPLLDKIEQLYETYRATTDEAKRKSIYHQIDSISGVAAHFAIANEYDKLMASIGSQGSNAYTDNEQTVYVEDIPSNQFEQWLKIQAERFRNPQMRLFHTELEAVYEEKNRSLDSDINKIFEAICGGLFQKHQYGTQTTIGTINHLKNPSIKKIKEYYAANYVPNNMAICMSGDFEPEKAIKLIDAYFGALPSKKVPEFTPAKEDAIKQPIVKNVYGPDAELAVVGYRLGGVNTPDADMLYLLDKVLANGTAGLIDLNLNQSQKLINGGTYLGVMKDYSFHFLVGSPKEGQTLEQVRDLLVSQLDAVKKGDFPDWLLSAIVNNMKLEQLKNYEQNRQRANAFVTAFTLDMPWENFIQTIDRISKITKQQLMDFVKSNYTHENYVVVYKHTGEDTTIQKVVKPEITPVDVNRNDQSPFFDAVTKMQTSDIQPVFLNYKQDIKQLMVDNKYRLNYVKNNENKTFTLIYTLDMGSSNDQVLPVAIQYLPFLGTAHYSPAQLQQEFYKLACSYTVSNTEDQTFLTLTGLSDNFEKALRLFEEVLADAQPNQEALDNLVSDVLKGRADAKLNKRTILFTAMYNYGIFGPKNSFTNVLSEQALKGLKAADLTNKIHGLLGYNHRVLFYGSLDDAELVSLLKVNHKLSDKLIPVPPAAKFEEQALNERNVYVVDYDMKQAEILMLSKGMPYDKSNVPDISLFNEYFGGGMSSVVFQDLRESKALAYSVFASYKMPKRKDRSNFVMSYIGTQSDKLPEAMAGMTSLLDNMPEAELTFTNAKKMLMQNIRTDRVTKADILMSFEDARKLGLDYDIRSEVYSKVAGLTLKDVKKFQETNIKNKPLTMLVLGNKNSLDIKTLEKYGKITYLKLEDIFGY